MEILTAFFCITAVCIGTRIPFVFTEATDRWLTYLLLQTYSTKKKCDLKMPRAVQGEAIQPYPPLSFFLSSRLPERYWKISAYLITYLSDACVGLLVFLILTHMLQNLGYPHNETYACSLVTALAFVCLPILLPVTARVKAPNGRALGFLVSTMYFISLWSALHVSVWFIFCAIVCAFLTVLSSKFAMQVVFFLSPLMATFLAAPILLVPPAVITLTVLLRPRSIWASICVDKIVHALRYKIIGSTAEHRNLFGTFTKYFKTFRSNYRSAAMMLRYKSPLLIALASIPYAFFVLATPLFSAARATIFTDPVLSFIYILTLSAGIVFLITSVGVFRIFGQSERYFEYASPFIIMFVVIVMAKLIHVGLILPFFMLGLNIALLLFIHISTNFHFLRKISRFEFSMDEDLNMVHQFLARLDSGNVGAVPIKITHMLMGMAARDGLDNLSYYHPTIATVPVRISDYKIKKEAFANPFLFIKNPEWVRETIGIDTWVEDIAFADLNTNQPFVQALREYEPIWVTKKYRVYRINA